jgi:hypothetical protein
MKDELQKRRRARRPGLDEKSAIRKSVGITKSVEPTGTGNLFGADGASVYFER